MYGTTYSLAATRVASPPGERTPNRSENLSVADSSADAQAAVAKATASTFVRESSDQSRP
jgi:hypothetical protein